MASDDVLLGLIGAVASACVSALRNGNKILFAGNGGSAADAQHLAGELVSRFAYDRPGLAAFALTTDTSVLTAIGNDYGYERLFARQVEAVGSAGDVLFGISTSGRSPNVLGALDVARKKGLVRERGTLRRFLDEEVERIDHGHLGHEVDLDPQLADRIGEDEPGQIVAVGVLLPVEEVGAGFDAQRVATNGDPAMGRGPQPDDVGQERDQPVIAVGRLVIESDENWHGESMSWLVVKKSR